MEITRIGIDIAKNVFQVHAVNAADQPVWQQQLTRGRFFRSLVTSLRPGCEIGMEACSSAHHWARQLQAKGFIVKLIPPQYVKPYVKRQKNDVIDAEAICEAMARPGMRYVSIKTIEQQDIQAVHRVRASVVGQRTAQANQIRGLVAEYGLVAPRQLNALRKAVPNWLEDAENELTPRFRRLLHQLWLELCRLDKRIAELDDEIECISEEHPDAKRLKQLQGVGPLIATALVARLGDGSQYRRGREAAASIGLTPRHAGTGGKNRLMGITKQGDRYLRSILIQGARNAVRQAHRKEDRLNRWITDLLERRHPHVAAVALANKTVRVAWAMLNQGSDFNAELAAA